MSEEVGRAASNSISRRYDGLRNCARIAESNNHNCVLKSWNFRMLRPFSVTTLAGEAGLQHLRRCQPLPYRALPAGFFFVTSTY